MVVKAFVLGIDKCEFRFVGKGFQPKSFARGKGGSVFHDSVVGVEYFHLIVRQYQLFRVECCVLGDDGEVCRSACEKRGEAAESNQQNFPCFLHQNYYLPILIFYDETASKSLERLDKICEKEYNGRKT